MTEKQTKPIKKSSFFSKIFIFLNIIAVLALLLSYLASHINPATSWTLAFFGLIYPLLLIVNIFFTIVWALNKKRIFLLSFIAILIGFNMIGRFVQFRIFKQEKPNSESMKILSYNVRNFDLYNYTKTWHYTFTKRNKIFDYLCTEKPNIVCFQEFYWDDNNDFNTSDTLSEILNAKEFHRESTAKKNGKYWGVATFSEYPIINRGKIPFETSTGNVCIFTDIKYKIDTIRVYNVHLESIRLSAEDYIFEESLNKKNIPSDKLKASSKRILSRLKAAYVKRGPQALLVAKHIKNCPYPIILCGDFNDSPSSFAYQQISSGLTDSFIESGSGFGQTYLGKYPSFRIDYILHSKKFKSTGFETDKIELSDHYPVKCYLKIKK